MPSNELQLAVDALPVAHDTEQMRAFNDVYTQHATFIWRTLRGLGVSQSDIDDAAQEVFITVFRKLGAFEGRSSLRTWLCGIAVGVARNHTRKRARRSQADGLLVSEHAVRPEERSEALDLVSRCLEDLDEPLRLVFVLAELEELTAPEIAEISKANVNTVYSRLRAAREQFEASLQRHQKEGA